MRTLANKLPEVLPEALAATSLVQSQSKPVYVLNNSAEKLPGFLSEAEALTAAKSIQNESERAYALSALAGKLPPELLPEVLTTVRAIQDKSDRANALNALTFGLSQMPSAILFPLWQDTLH